MSKMRKYRHEIKYTITTSLKDILISRLKLIMDMDTNGYNSDGSYEIKSLYFDDFDDTSYYEKLNGILYRKKYRIRIYNNSRERISLERKFKHNNLTSKDSTLISLNTYSKIINGKISEINERSKLLDEFLGEARVRGLKPSVIVKYNRLAFTYPISNIRITFDMDIANEGVNLDVLNESNISFKALDPGLVVLEVKYDEILPKMIADIIGTIPINREATSKFQKCKKIQ